MKPFTALLFAFVIGVVATVQAQTPNPWYDKALADSLGADDYGMKSYIFVVLKTGSANIEDKQQVSDLFSGHMDNINRLVADKKLIVAGPFGRNDQGYRGLFILDVKTKEEAHALVETDPAVKAKLLDVELFEWYGSAALPTYLAAAQKITKTSP